MHWDDLKFYTASVAFIIMALFHWQETRHSADLNGSLDRAFNVASDCINHEQARVDTLRSSITAALVGRANADRSVDN